MGGQTISTSTDKIGALDLQSSCYGAVIPMMYGVCQVAGQLLWYNGFKQVAHTTSTSVCAMTCRHRADPIKPAPPVMITVSCIAYPGTMP